MIPDWVFPSILSAIIGAILAEWRWLIMFPFRVLRHHPIEGIWYCHFYSVSSDSSLFRVEKWRIKKGFRRKFSVRIDTLHDPDTLIYKGWIDYFHNHMIVEFNSVNHTHLGRMFMRFSYSVIQSDSKIIGLALAPDYDGQPSAQANLLCREELSEDEIKDALKKHTSIENNALFMRVGYPIHDEI